MATVKWYPCEKNPVIVLRCLSSFALGLLLANCAGQVDSSKSTGSNRGASDLRVRFARADTNPDGTPLHPYGASRGSGGKYVSKEVRRSESDATLTSKVDPPIGASDTERHAINARLTSPQPNESTTVRSSRKPQFLTPVIGTERWKKEEAENEKLEKQLDARLRGSICTGC